MSRWLMLCAALSVVAAPAVGHEIYSSVKGKDGTPCCNNFDCSATIYREKGDTFEFLTRENHWVPIPIEMIIFLPVPGDELASTPNRAHLCYRAASQYSSPDRVINATDGGQSIYLYCAFISPQGL
jgi:hypothetical protein